ncbi:MAG: hypothetical protein ACRDTZ_17595 [Pseudonocardiaceae bacterium]
MLLGDGPRHVRGQGEHVALRPGHPGGIRGGGFGSDHLHTLRSLNDTSTAQDGLRTWRSTTPHRANSHSLPDAAGDALFTRMHYGRMIDQVSDEDCTVELAGDAYITFTAPFYAQHDPLEPQERCTLPTGDDLDGRGALVRSKISLSPLLQGSLTYERPTLDLLTFFVGGEAWRDHLLSSLNHQLLAGRPEQAAFDSVDVSGMLFPDGYGSIAVTLKLANGWDPAHRRATLAAVGRDGREPLAAELRSLLLPPVERTLRRCGAGGASAAALPYFNLTYAGSTDHPTPGRSSLNDELRVLVYPDSPLPLVSCSPWFDEFLYTGYAYNLLATPQPRPSIEKMTLLLLILDVSYARLARTAAAADESLRNNKHNADVAWLAQFERQLRAEYQALVTPTFSFDHHVLQMRDAVLRSWDTAKLQSRAEDLLTTVRRTVELRLAEEQARRVGRVQLVVMVLTVLSAIQTTDAAFSLFHRFFG